MVRYSPLNHETLCLTEGASNSCLEARYGDECCNIAEQIAKASIEYKPINSALAQSLRACEADKDEET